MELGTMIEKLEWCQELDDERMVFLVGRDSLFKKARDKDIWSLVGPVTLGRNPSRFMVERQSLETVVRALKKTEMTAMETETAAAEAGPSSRRGYRQELFFLVNHRVSETVCEGGTDPEGGKFLPEARDKDIWSLSNPLPPQTLVGTFLDIPCPHCTAAGNGDGEFPVHGALHDHTTHLLISLQGIHRDLPALL